MKRTLNIYRYMLRYPTYIIFGIITLGLYVVFSGVSITLIIPIFDHIFITDASVPKVFLHFSEFYGGLKQMIVAFFNEHSFSFSMNSTKDFWAELKHMLTLTDPWLLLQIICYLLIVIILAKNLFFFINKLMFLNLQGKIIKDIRNDCYKNYLSQNYSFFNKNQAGDSVVRMINDIEAVNSLYIDKIFSVLKEVSELLIYIYIGWSLNLKLFYISMIILPLFILTVTTLSRKIRKYARRNLGQLSEMFSHIIEVLHNMRIVKAFCKEDYEYKKQVTINKSFFKNWRKMQMYSILGHPISEISSMVIGVVILIIGSIDILSAKSDFTFGDFTAFLFAIFSMMRPLKQLANDIASIRRAMVSIDRVSEILELKSEIEEKKDSIIKTEFTNRIEFQKVDFEYIKDIPVLTDCNLTILRGQRIALVGASGSGKTTIANLINRMYDVTSGEVLIDDVNVKDIKISNLRKLFGVVTQESILFSDTIENNIRYGSNANVTMEAVKTACHFAYADEFIDKLPDGYQTLILPNGSNLSGGQKQRLCIARSIIDNPPILIFDEATSALDTDSEQKVQKAVDMATSNRTVIIIAHRLSTILSADKIFVLDKGSLIGVGKHTELLENCPIYHHFYQLQFENAME